MVIGLRVVNHTDYQPTRYTFSVSRYFLNSSSSFQLSTMQLNLEREFSTFFVGNTKNKRVRSNIYHVLLTYISNITFKYYVLGSTCLKVPIKGVHPTSFETECR